MADAEQIRRALGQLSPDIDEHWTQDGLPRIEVVAGLTGDKALKRGDITDAAPTFTRDDPRPVPPGRVVTDPAPEGEARPAPEFPVGELVEVPQPDPEDPDSYDATLAALRHNRAELREQRAAAQRMLEETDRLERDLMRQREQRFPPMTQAQLVKEYQRQQVVQRQGAMARAQEAAAIMGKRQPVGGRSPVDEAMARPKGRQALRPGARG